MNHSNQNTFCSLSLVMSQYRHPETPVAFLGTDIKSWQQFQCDVSASIVYISKQSALRWAICTYDSYWFAVAFFALAYTNKSIVLPGNHQPAALLELAPQFDAIIVDHTIAIPAQLAPINVEDLRATSLDTASSFSPLDPDAISVTLYTSGSSGRPKAILKHLSQLDAELEQLEQLWGHALEQCHIYSTVSHQHIYGLLFRLLWPLAAQRPFCRINQDYPEQVVQHAADNAVLISSPALLKRLSAVDGKQHYRSVYSSGGPLNESAAQQSLSILGVLPYEVFGSTETGGIGYRQQVTAQSVWQLFPQVEAKLNAEGCIALKSAHIDPNNWLQTADQCELIDSHHFILKGRTDRIVKIEEKRVSLAEVERRIQSLAWVSDVAVIVLETPQRRILAAAIVLSEAGEQPFNELGRGSFGIQLRQLLRDWLEPVAIPRQLRFVDEIPLNSQGKLQFDAIERLFERA